MAGSVRFIHSDVMQGFVDSYKSLSLSFSKPVIWWLPDTATDISLFDRISEQELLHILNNKGFLVFDHSGDPFFAKYLYSHDLKYLTDFFTRNNISHKKLIVLAPVPKNVFYSNQIGYSYTTLLKSKRYEAYCNFVFFNRLFTYTQFQNYRYEDIQRPIEKHFLTLNRRDNLNRRFNNYLLHKNNLFNKGFVSHQRAFDNNYVKKPEDHKLEINQLRQRDDFDVPLYLQCGYKRHFIDQPVSKSDATINMLTHKTFSSSSCFEIVVETDIENLFITEKTLKPIICKKPFLLAASSNSLRFLRKYGFQTFDSLFDESYDTIDIYYDRMHAMYRNVKNMCRHTLTDCSKYVNMYSEIYEFNYNHFLNHSWDFNLKRNIQKIIDEFTNV
jgi:hypothetical protein